MFKSCKLSLTNIIYNNQSNNLRQLWIRSTSMFSLSTLWIAGNAAKRWTILRQSSRSRSASMNFGYLYPSSYRCPFSSTSTKQAQKVATSKFMPSTNLSPISLSSVYEGLRLNRRSARSRFFFDWAFLTFFSYARISLNFSSRGSCFKNRISFMW